MPLYLTPPLCSQNSTVASSVLTLITLMGRRSAERVTLLLLLTVASEGGTINVWPLPANVATHPDAGRLSVQQDLQLSVASAVGHHANNRTSVSINTSMEKLGVLERALVRYKYILRRMGSSPRPLLSSMHAPSAGDTPTTIPHRLVMSRKHGGKP